MNPIENVTKKAIYFKSILVNPGETIHKVIYLRYDFFSPKITIPQIYVKKSAISPTGVISSRRSRYTAYIGKNYLDILSEVKKNCLNKKRLSIATFYGSSGTGKSRLLRECSDVFLNSGYKVFSFNYSSPDSSETEGISLYSLIQELILRLYGLDEDIINQITENKLDQIPEKNQTGRLDLIRFVFENRNSLSKVNSASFVPLFEKMGSEKLLYIFDDIQTYDDDIITFLSDFIKYSKNVQRKVLCAVLFAVNTDNTYSQVVKNFVIELQNMHHDLPYNCYGKHLSGFENKGVAILFLKECLGLRKDLDLSLNNLNISLRPKYLAEFSNLLIEKNVIDYNSTEAYIADSVGFSYDAHKLLSDSLNGIIGKRWEIYCGYHKFENVRKNLLCFILFAGSINVSVGAITPEYKEEITSLYNHGFIKHEPMSCIYTFEHDSIKNFFGDFYTDWMETSINAISNQIITTTNRDIIFLCNILSLSLLSDKDIFRYLKLKLHDILRKKSDEVIVHGLMNDKYIVNDLYGFLMSILLNSRDHYGEEYVGNLYQIIYDEYDESSKKLSDDQYCNLLLGYAENQLKQKNTQLSLNIYNEVLRIKSDIRTVCTIENRRFVCGRVGGKIHQFELNWKRSVKLSNENNFYDLYIENMFDYAQSFFLYHDKTDLVLEYLCRGCDFYKEHPVKSMRGHYLYRKIQIYFIKKEKEELGKCIDDALDEVCINNDISSKLFFMIQFKIFKIMYGMIYDHDIDAIALLDELNLLQRMQSHNQMYRCFYLYSKYYLSRMEWDKSFSMYLKTFKIILENDYTEEIYLQQEFMLDDMIYNMHKYHFPIKDYDFSFFSVFSGWDKRYLRLCEGDFDTYISDAIVTGTDNKDGYLFF